MDKKLPTTPKTANFILKLFIKEEPFSERTGDLQEIFPSQVKECGLTRARLWYTFQILFILFSFFKTQTEWGVIMFKNYLKVALRNFRRQKVFSSINVVGLSVGMTVSILIFLLIRYERSYDTFHQNTDTIYRVADDDYSTTAANLAQALKQEFPEIKHAARVVKLGGFLQNERGYFNETEIQCVDPEFFNIFSYPLATGNLPEPLEQPFQVLITQELAAKLFGNNDPVDQTVNYNNRFDFIVKGVLQNIPENTHMKFDMLASMLTYRALLGPDYEHFLNRWGSHDFWTYIQLQDNVNTAQLEDKFPQFETKYKDLEKMDIFLQPVRSIHTSGNLRYEMETNTEVRNLYFLSTIALLILLIACFNFMNLATAQVTKRSKEVGLRKVVGSSRFQLIKQFFGESMVFSLVAMGFSLLIVKISLTAFNSFIQRNLELDVFNDIGILAIFLGIAFFTGLISGCYPAFFLSSFEPMRILKGGKFGSKKSLTFRNVLVVFQFSITIFLIFTSLVVFNQLNFLKDKSFGNIEDPIVNILLSDNHLRSNPALLENELRKNPQILDLTSSYNLPILIPTGNNVTWDGQTEEERFIIRQTNVDYNFIDFYGIEIAKGRSFNRENTSDKSQSVLINETAARRIGWEDPIGKRINYGVNEGMVVIGVMKDFNFKPLYDEIEPLVISLLQDSGYFGGVNYISAKISADHIPQTLEFFEKTWENLSSKYPLSYSFLDERIEARYQTEQKMGSSITYMAIIAVFLACMGIFGLSLFTVEEKTKEIGIRKILGATAVNIVFILSKEFVRWVVISALLTFPLAWFVMNKWLQNFAYRTNIGFDAFAYALALSLLVAFLAVSFQSIRAALGNPVNALRHE
jgi:putative ABC transport system permease protein